MGKKSKRRAGKPAKKAWVGPIPKEAKLSEWKDYDPSWLVEAARQQYPQLAWLHASLSQCTRYAIEIETGEIDAYYCFVKTVGVANQPGSNWQFWTNIKLENTQHGLIVLDVLKGGQIGGIEFIDRLTGGGTGGGGVNKVLTAYHQFDGAEPTV